MRKTKISVLCCLIIICLSSMCFASIPSSELCLDKIKVGTSRQKITELQGTPIKEEQYTKHALWKGNIKICDYKKENIVFANNQAILINTTSDLETPSGLHVGMTKEDVLDLYSVPDILQETGKEYKWFYQSATDAHKGMSIVIDKNTEQIKEITIGYFD